MAEDDSNGRVTLALVGQKLDALIDAQRTYNETQVELMKKISQHEKDIALMVKQSKDNERDIDKLANSTDAAIDRLNNKFNLFSGANSFMGIVATALAIIFGVRQ